MLKCEREQEILAALKENGGYVTVKHLCDKLYASESSIRRDLADMEKKGLIQRSYGGAELTTNYSRIAAFNLRYTQNAAAKKKIALKAASLIGENSIVFLDQSSTALHLAELLPNRRSITVITNNVEIMHLLSESNITVISSGGFLSRENRSCLVGNDAKFIFENSYADFAFVACRALSDDGIISDFAREEVIIRDAIMKNAKKKVFLCDSKKFGIRSAYKQCSLSEVDYLITEEPSAAEKYKTLFPHLAVL